MWLNDFYHTLNPIAFAIGPFAVRWYGLAYMAGFICAGIIMVRYARRWELDINAEDVISLITGIALGVIIGGRLGYVLFYGAGEYLKNPISILYLNEGGMSFHGGLIGAVLAGWICCRHMGLNFLTMCDLGACGAPAGLFFGRCANFVNGELWGKECDLPWAVMFDNTGGGAVYRHPSQLYEAILEGLVILLVLFLLSRQVPPRPQGTFIGTLLALYGVFRFCIEFVRLPDVQLGYLLGTGWLTMGQVLSLPLVVAGVALLVWAAKTNRPQIGHVA